MSALPAWQQAPLQRLLDAHASGRLGHALLLAGPAGLGKRAVAQALVQRLLCDAPPGAPACGQCRGCVLLAAGSHPDSLRITLDDDAKQLKVEQIRTMGAKLALTAQRGGAQVAVIDPADLLNVNAANALLKTLEEPHPGCYLVLVADLPFRLPATIRSRCQTVLFQQPDGAAARDWLLRQAGVPAADVDAALTLARGNPGRALHLIETDGLGLQRAVVDDLRALTLGKAGAADIAARWSDERLALRLQLAAEWARDRMADGLAGGAGRGLTVQADFPKLAAWFDQANQTREWLGTTIRADLAVVELLRAWRAVYPRS